MGRGKIEIKRIENATNRQVTYSKRRNGIFKKAQELTVLCDAKVSLIMFSNNGKLHEFVSPSTTTKKMYDDYQKVLGIDLWETHYQKMQEQLRRLRQTNNKLRIEIRQRMGKDLEDLNLDQLCSLENKIEDAVHEIRDRKYHVLKTQTDTCRKKVRNLEQQQGNLFLHFESMHEDPVQYNMMEIDGDRESAIARENGALALYAFSHHDPNDLRGHGEFGSQELHLA